jgi:hypothetical protein
MLVCTLCDSFAGEVFSDFDIEVLASQVDIWRIFKE